jgi:sulfite reductase (ferredoxin)
MACPALPTCGLAIAEAERVMPELTGQIQARLAAAGLAREPITVRVTGCPNGCARPYTAEIGIVGQSVKLYGIYLGASPVGTRLGFLFASNIPFSQIAPTLEPLFEFFRASRIEAERFGDFCHRVGAEALRAASEAVAK